jgi:hypothetical protein
MDVKFRRILASILFVLALQGCGDGSDGGEPAADGEANGEADIDAELLGSVGDGPVANAQLTVRSKSGDILQNAVGSQLAGYNITLKTKGKNYPLFIDATGGTDLVTNLTPDFTLRSAATEPRSRTVANLNPFTTLALATARQMTGGPTASNIKTALDTVVKEFSSGLTTLAVSGGAMTTSIDDSNLAEMVKSSETLAEIFRRVGSIRRSAGKPASIDDAIEVLGADLIDGKLDGRGAAKTDPHATAATTLARGQVVVESMTNTLRVGGQPVTTALDNAINQLASKRTTAPTAALPITAGMIAAAKTGTAAAKAILPSAALTTLEQRLGALTPGMLAPAVAQALPSDASATFAPALTQIIAGAQRDIDAINSLGAATTNAPPTISGTPATTATVGTAYAFQPTASDPNSDPLTYTIMNRPAWLTFSAATGRLEGTPAAANVGTASNIVIGVSDGSASAQLPAFSIVVSATAGSAPPPTPTPPPNSAPTITGTPATSVVQGTLYSFQPTANDANGDVLTFSIVNKPAWATFDTATGKLQGTPGATYLGTTTGIVISVKDGAASVSLPAFDITVQAIATGSATLSWTPPTQNTDGSPLTDLAGFKIKWGTSQGSYPNSVTINNPGITTYIVENLAPNTYFFVATAFDTSGNESGNSNAASKTVQ